MGNRLSPHEVKKVKTLGKIQKGSQHQTTSATKVSDQSEPTQIPEEKAPQEKTETNTSNKGGDDPGYITGETIQLDF